MLDKKFSKQGLSNYNYRKTAWYQTIRAENRSFKYNLIFFSLIVSLFFPLILLITETINKKTDLLLNYIVPFVVICLMIVYLMKFSRLKNIIFILLGLCIVGLFFSLYLPGGRNVYFVIISAFPLLSIQLRGSVKGSIWYFTCTVLFGLCYLFQRFAFFPSWVINIDVIDFFNLIGTSLLVFFISFFAERRHETMIGRLTDLLVFDEATGLPNKDVLIHSIEPKIPYMFAIIKIVNFSDLVALFGYEFSDTISQFASQKLRKNERKYNYKTFQLKYNEYGILFKKEKSPKIDEISQCLNEFIKSLELEALPWETDKIRLVYRIGATIVDPLDPRSPLSKADVALKKAERGHSAITIFEDDNTEKENAYNYVIKFTELINNRENDTFRAVFQPVFNGNGTLVEWYEALLRIQRQDGTYVSIYPYLNVAKSTGLYQCLSDFILKKTAEAIFEFDVDISVNISINDIIRPEFITLIDEAYQKIKNKKGKIIFEILESDELVELDKGLWFINYIAKYGFKIAIDDFGTGYSNYCSLVNLPIDIVKIDGSLIKKIQTDDNAKTLVEGIVHFCKKSNKKIVAEFIEDKQVFESVKSMNIDFLQGYYLGVPSSISECPLFSAK